MKVGRIIAEINDNTIFQKERRFSLIWRFCKLLRGADEMTLKKNYEKQRGNCG